MLILIGPVAGAPAATPMRVVIDDFWSAVIFSHWLS